MNLVPSVSNLGLKRGPFLWICPYMDHHHERQVAPPGVKWMNHIHYTGSCIALTFLFIKPATKRDLLVNRIAAGTW